MTIDESTLHNLCLRAAAGDERARGDFNRHVPPLVEVVVHRWLRQQAATAGIPASATLPSRSRQVADDICARMIAACEGTYSNASRSSEESVASFSGDDTVRWR
ncbi:MAG TPA: hypothetical protein VFI31_12075 [Pirellulales bacterium]|nr:hypothetical protein [Pirellulales bacterium]